jgi:hypothetical protein
MKMKHIIFTLFLATAASYASALVLVAPKLHEMSKNFHFKSIPYEQALHHIHTLEHLSNLHFQIQNTTKPVHCGPYTVVSAQCSIKSLSHEIRMFSKQPDVSHIVCLKDGTPQIMFELQVTPAFYGHSMTVTASTYLNAPLWINMMLTPIWAFFSSFEDAQLFYLKYDKNISKYRTMVLKNVLGL